MNQNEKIFTKKGKKRTFKIPKKKNLVKTFSYTIMSSLNKMSGELFTIHRR